MNFGKNIKKIRSIKKLSQAKFAELFDLTRSSVSAYEEERAEPKLDVIIRIAAYFNLTVDKLVNSEITVNEFYKFNIFNDDFTKGISSQNNQLKHLKFATLPLISSFNVLSNSLEKIKAEEFITLPNFTDEHLAVLIHRHNFSAIPETVKTDDILVINKKFMHEPGMLFKGKLWLLKLKHELYLGEMEQLPTNDLVFYPEKATPFHVITEHVVFMLPVVTFISNDHHLKDENLNQMQKIDYKINDLYKRLSK